MPDPYDHMREAFHIVADGLMEWQDPPGRAETPRDATEEVRTSYRASDVPTLEKAAESLARAGDFTNAVALWALALRVRHGA
jgi:hypothetical protein